MKPSEYDDNPKLRRYDDNPKWRRAVTYRQLRDHLIKLSDQQLEEAVCIQEPKSNGGIIHYPISGFSSKAIEGMGTGPYLIREPMEDVCMCDCCRGRDIRIV